MPNICDFDRILKTESNLQHFTRNRRINNFHDFERDEADRYLRRARLLNVMEKWITICLVNVFERRESKCCQVLMKHRRKVKGEQVITLHMAQQQKIKNINVVPGQLFCRQWKDKFLSETALLFWWSRESLVCYKYWQWIHWVSNSKEKAPIS